MRASKILATRSLNNNDIAPRARIAPPVARPARRVVTINGLVRIMIAAVLS